MRVFTLLTSYCQNAICRSPRSCSTWHLAAQILAASFAFAFLWLPLDLGATKKSKEQSGRSGVPKVIITPGGDKIHYHESFPAGEKLLLKWDRIELAEKSGGDSLNLETWHHLKLKDGIRLNVQGKMTEKGFEVVDNDYYPDGHIFRETEIAARESVSRIMTGDGLLIFGKLETNEGIAVITTSDSESTVVVPRKYMDIVAGPASISQDSQSKKRRRSMTVDGIAARHTMLFITGENSAAIPWGLDVFFNMRLGLFSSTVKKWYVPAFEAGLGYIWMQNGARGIQGPGIAPGLSWEYPLAFRQRLSLALSTFQGLAWLQLSSPGLSGQSTWTWQSRNQLNINWNEGRARYCLGMDLHYLADQTRPLLSLGPAFAIRFEL